MKKLTTGKIWMFAIGQFGWSVLSGLISNWLVYFYQPDVTAIEQGQTLFIPQGLAIGGVITVIGAITAFGRVFDAFTDPWIASKLDRCKSKQGRRIPFLKWAAFPLALSVVLVFWSPVSEVSWINAGFLFVMILIYYLSITAYCTPYNALIPELGHDQQTRLNISTAISFTILQVRRWLMWRRQSGESLFRHSAESMQSGLHLLYWRPLPLSVCWCRYLRLRKRIMYRRYPARIQPSAR